MAKSPFYNIILKEPEKDITEWVSNFRFEDVAKQDNLIELRCNKATLDMLDDPDLKIGKEIIYTFGFMGGDRSAKRTATITSLDIFYAGSIQLVIKCADKGFILKKRVSNRVFEEKTSTDIVKEIASQFGFEVEAADTSTVRTIPMGGKTYYNFIQHLAKKENLNCFVRDNTIYFIERDLGKEAARLFTYGDPDGTVKTFRPRYKQNHKGGNKTSAFGMDTDKNQLMSFFGGMNQQKSSSLGKKFVSYDANGKELQTTDSDGGTFIVEAANDFKEMENKSLKNQDDELLKSLECDLVIELDPDIYTDEIFTMAGVAKSHEGNWYIEKITHTINGSGGQTTIKGYKNATNKGTGDNNDDATNINNTIGSDQPKKTTTVDVVRFDANGKQLN